MSRLRQVKDIYSSIINTITTNEEEWKEYLKFASRLYKYKFDNSILIYAQKPDATAVADMRFWNKRIGRYVNKGTKSIAVFDATKPELKLNYLFDIADTNGSPYTMPRLWQLNEEISLRLIHRLNSNLNTNESNLENLISKHIVKPRIKNYEIDLPISNYSLRNQYIKTVEDSVNFTIFNRCELDLFRFQDLASFINISDFNTKEMTYKLGVDVTSIAEEILREIEGEVYNTIKILRSEKNEEKSIDRTGISGRQGRDIISQDTDISGRGSRPDATGEIRKDGNDISQRELPEQIQLVENRRRIDATNAQSRSRSQGETEDIGEKTTKEGTHKESNEHLRNLQTQGYDKENSRGNSINRNSIQKEIEKSKLQINMFESQDNRDSFLFPNDDEGLDFIEIENIEDLSDEVQPINYKYNSEDEIGVGGLKTKFRNNVEAIKTLKVIENEDRLATIKEQSILARYVGWGGMPQAFDKNSIGWSNEYAELKSILTPEEYNSARASTPNAHYTSPKIIKGIYKALERFGYKEGNILEPAMGVGNFFSTLPDTMKDSKLYGVELDDISGRMSKQLYQKVDIKIQGFEEVDYPDNFFDITIGNVPFGDYKIYDPKYNKHNFLIHDYFFAKAIEKVRPGGIVAFITSKGTMDKENDSVRRYLSERADLIGAIRLPNTAFKDNANTEVTTDIIFLQKRERLSVKEADWLKVENNEDGIPINEYFIRNPEMMLGKMIFDTRMYGEDSKYTTLINDDEKFELEIELNNAIENLKGSITKYEMEGENLEDLIPADPTVKNYTYTLINDELYYRENTIMRKMDITGKSLEKITGLHHIREITRDIINIQMNGCTKAELKEKQEVLNKRYDKFVKEHGYITSRANAKAFEDDNDYPLLCSLEVVDENEDILKADMFTKQTIRPHIVITEVDTANEALMVSLNERGKVDIPFMLELYETTSESLIKELKGQIYLNPIKYEEEDITKGWETQDEYLSGNVREKLKIAKVFAENKPDIFMDNILALEKVQPIDLDASEIDIRLGTTWVENKDIEKFIYETLETPRYLHNSYSRWSSGNDEIKVQYNKMSANWNIQNKSRDYSVLSTETFGTKRMNAYQIIEDTLNLNSVTARDRVDDGDSVRYVVNQKETMLAREKQHQLKE